MVVFEPRDAADPKLAADLLLVPVAGAAAPEKLRAYGSEVPDAVARALAAGDYDGKAGAILSAPPVAGSRFPRIALVGLGTAADVNAVGIRRAFAAAARGLFSERIRTVAIACGAPLLSGADARARVAAAVDGLIEGGYRWSLAASSAKRPERFLVCGEGERARGIVRDGIAAGSAIGDAVRIAREIANTPANRMSPDDMAGRARAIGKQAGLTVRVLDEAQLARDGCEAIVTVGAGSTRPPRLIALTYDPGTGGDPVALVGKGLVFDTGGLDIKPSASMISMKMDKCGAAAVLGAMSAVRALGVRVPVVAVVPAVENSISGTAYRPSDIIGTRAGKTVEVLSTDAEGRLVLADAIDWVIEKHHPRAIVDIATLTGAAFYALGDLAAAVLGTDAGLVARLVESGGRTGDRLWELPLWPDAIADVESSVADVRNTGPFGAGTIAGAAFLRKFTGDVPWAHLDIAGVSWNRRDAKVGATGFGTRLLLDALMRWPAARPARAARTARPARRGRAKGR